MLNYKKKYFSFLQLIKKKKYQNCELSYFDFFQKILKTSENKKNSFFYLLKNLVLIILSVLTIIKIFFKQSITGANYFIIKKNNNSYIDPRSEYYLKKKKLNSHLNFVKSETFTESIKIYFFYPNIIFIFSFKYFIKNIFFNKKNLTFQEIHTQNKYFYFVIKKIFSLLKIKQIHMIDDYRIMPLIVKICNELKINCIGYSHGRISKYSISHIFFKFDKYYVWSKYLKKKLLDLNSKYKSKDIVVNYKIKYNKKLYTQLILKKNSVPINLLFVLDKELNEITVIKIIKNIHKEKNINLLIKLRPNENPLGEIINFCKKYKIKYFYQENIYEIILKEKINFLMSTSSTMLLEASLMKIFPLMLVTKNEYSSEMIDDKVVFPIYHLNNFYSQIKKIKNNSFKFNEIYKNAWN
jgi:hypothetical protein